MTMPHTAKAYRILSLLNFLPDLHIVGGYVRDMMLGIESSDIDLASSATPEEVFDLCHHNNILALLTGVPHGTITICLGKERYEVTTFRKDISTDGRRATVIWAKTIEEDLARRDFTINAMALDKDLNLIDPFNGRLDISDKTLRCVGDPQKRFTEDYLRIIRAIRFAAGFSFTIHPETWHEIELLAGDVTQTVTQERITDEFNKAFAHKGAGKFVRIMYALGILQNLIPEFNATNMLQQNPIWHPEGDVLTHVCQVVDRAPSSHRWHALLHDIGKKDTAQLTEDGWYSFQGHAGHGASLIPIIATTLCLPNKLRDSIAATTRLHMRPAAYRGTEPTDKAIRRFQVQAGQYLNDIEIVCRADCGPKQIQQSWKLFEDQEDPLRPILTGVHLIRHGYKPGVAFGVMLNKAFEYQIDNNCHDVKELLAVATRVRKE